MTSKCIKQNSPEKHWILSIMLRSRDTAISKNVVGKSACDNPERYCGLFWDHCSSQKFWKNGTRDHGLCFPGLKRSSKSRFYSYGVRKSVLIISHTTFRDCCVHFFSNNLSRNSCIQNMDPWSMDLFVDPVLAGLPLLFYCTGNHMISCAIWNK